MCFHLPPHILEASLLAATARAAATLTATTLAAVPPSPPPPSPQAPPQRSPSHPRLPAALTLSPLPHSSSRSRTSTNSRPRVLSREAGGTIR